MGPRIREDTEGYPHPFDKLRAGSNLPPLEEEGVERVRRDGNEILRLRCASLRMTCGGRLARDEIGGGKMGSCLRRNKMGVRGGRGWWGWW